MIIFTSGPIFFVNRSIRRRRWLTSSRTERFCLDLFLRWRSRVKFHKLRQLARDFTGQHYCPVLSDVSLLRLSERRRWLKFRVLEYMYYSVEDIEHWIFTATDFEFNSSSTSWAIWCLSIRDTLFLSHSNYCRCKICFIGGCSFQM